MPDPQPNQPSNAPSLAESFSGRALENLKTALGDAWSQKLSDAERGLVIDMLDDASTLAAQNLLDGVATPKEWQQLWAQTAHVTSIESTRMKHYVQVAVARAIFGGLGQFVRANAQYLI